MKRNIISFGKILASASLLTVLFLASCKDKEKNFETPCEAPAAPHADNNSPVALNAVINLTAESIANATYAWSGPNGFSSSEQNPSFTFSNKNQGGQYTVIITVNGCSSQPGYTYVSSCNTAPLITTTNSSRADSNFVIGDTISLNCSFNPSATYSWTGPNGFTSTLQNPNFIGLKATDAGVYTVSMTLPNGAGGGCTTPSTSYNLIIKPVVPSTTATGVGSIGGAVSLPTSTYVDTVNGTLNMSASSSPGATFKWSGPNGFSATSAAISIPNLTKAAEGTYYVHAVLNGVDGDSSLRKVIIKYAYTPCGTTDSILNPNTGSYVKIVQIGNRCWTKGNINKNSSTDVWTFAEVNTTAGADSQSVCPTNWHLASDADFNGLASFVNNDGNALKDVTEGSGAGAGTNTSGFSAKLSINIGAIFNVTAATSTSSTNVKVFSTAGLNVGDEIYVSSGNGVLAPGTTVVSITNATNFVISTPPTTALGLANKITVKNRNAFFWTNTRLSNFVWYRQLNSFNNTFFKSTEDVAAGKSYSVRCIRD